MQDDVKDAVAVGKDGLVCVFPVNPVVFGGLVQIKHVHHVMLVESRKIARIPVVEIGRKPKDDMQQHTRQNKQYQMIQAVFLLVDPFSKVIGDENKDR